MTGLHAIVERAPTGVFNLVGRGVLPLSRITRGLGRRSLTLPAGIGRGALGALWSAQLGDLPPVLVDYIRWSWVCDGSRLERELGFAPTRTTADVVKLLAAGPLQEAA